MLVDLAGGVGGEARRAQVVGVVKISRDLLEVLGARPVALAGGRDIQPRHDARGPSEICFEVRLEAPPRTTG